MTGIFDKFWFGDKSSSNNNIIIVVANSWNNVWLFEIISDDLDVANTLNEYLQNVKAKLGITEYSDNFGTNTAALGDLVDIALEKLKDHPSVEIIKENIY